MQKIRIIAMGKLTEAAFRDAAAEYARRAGRFFDLSVDELRPEQTPQNPSPGEIAKALDREADRILAALPPRAVVCSLCVEGKPMSSEAFAAWIDRQASGGAGEVVFLVGSSHGMAERVKQRASVRLSVSEMTFPHELFRVMLLEQIYRAGEILAGGKYHK